MLTKFSCTIFTNLQKQSLGVLNTELEAFLVYNLKLLTELLSKLRGRILFYEEHKSEPSPRLEASCTEPPEEFINYAQDLLEKLGNKLDGFYSGEVVRKVCDLKHLYLSVH